MYGVKVMMQVFLLGRPLVNFGYKSAMKKVATEKHVHCAYGGEELNAKNPATAEHVKPKYYGGACNDNNYLPVCAQHNGERGHTPLWKYLGTHPEAWANIKRAIEELRYVITPKFNGPKWAVNITKAVETEARRPLDIVSTPVGPVTTLQPGLATSNLDIAA